MLAALICIWPLTGCRSGGNSNPFAESSIHSFGRPSVGLKDFVQTEKDSEPAASRSGATKPTSSSEIRQVGFQELDNNAATDRLQLSDELDTDSNSQQAELDQATASEDSTEQFGVNADNEIPPIPQSTFDGLGTAVQNRPTLTLPNVLVSVADSYPEIEIAIGEIEAANGKVLASWGEFDTVASAHSISQPLGFYQTYRNGVGLARPLYEGGEVYGTYRIGDGNFEPWYGERETNEGGEFKAGFSLPFLKDRFIDKRRAELLKSGASRREVRADVESRLLLFQRFATQAYWDWVASGRAVLIQRQLLALAKERVKNIRERVAGGDLAEIAELDNNRFIAKRQNSIIKALRGLEKAAIKLSIFYRDANGLPLIATANQLPEDLPPAGRLALEQILADAANAIAVRPELIALRAAREAACIDRQYAENLMLPKLDMKGFVGQDVGGETSSLGDKTPFEAQLGVFAEVPIERRKGLGKRQAANGKINQIDAKARIVQDKIRAEIQDAASALNAAFDQIQQSRRNVELTGRSLDVGRELFDSGDIDLLSLNIYETSFADAKLELLDAQFKYFLYQAIYETAASGAAQF
jgi:outer membrane protein TolC